MSSKVVMKQNGNLAKLVKKLRQLNKQNVKFGYFQEQGIHTASGLHFTELMRIHEYGLGGVWVRPVLGVSHAWPFTLKGEMESASFTKLMGTYLNDYVQKDMTNDQLADRFAMWSIRTVEGIFGNSPPLKYTYNETPLIDTGELADNFAWKVSWRGVIHTL